MIHRLKTLAGALAVLAALLAPAAAHADEGWVDVSSTARRRPAGSSVAARPRTPSRTARWSAGTVLGEKNSFLCPPKEYADFVLEFEVRVDPKVNSGVQIRRPVAPRLPRRRRPRLPDRDRPLGPGVERWDLRRAAAGVADEPEGRPEGAEGIQGRRVEPLPRGGVGRSPAHVGQRRARLRPHRRGDALGLHRLPGAPGEGGGPRRQVAPDPDQGAAPRRDRPHPEHAHGRRAGRGLAAALGRAHDLGLAQREGQGVPEGRLGDQGRRASVLESGGAESRAGGDIVTARKPTPRST